MKNDNTLSRRNFLGCAFAATFAIDTTSGREASTMPPSAVSSKPPYLRIAHLTDPQFGFGPKFKTVAENYPVDMARFEKEIELVNAMKPDLAVITGDMTHKTEDVVKDWPRLLKAFEVPVVVTPGNHDMGNRVTRENFERYLSVFGYDRKAFDVKGWRIIAGNTQFLFAPSHKEGREEYEAWFKKEQEAYNAWVKEEFRRAKKYNGKVIVAGHYPPYVNGWNEKDSYENFPQKLRMDRVRMYRHSGAKFYLAGHTHRFALRGYKELTILNAEVTSNSFDCRPYGFRMFEVGEDFNYSYNFVGV